MTRKDYVKAAEIIRAAHREYTDHAPILFIQDRMATWFEQDNPNFDRARFMVACGLESES